jgi:hypothetical protein
MNTQENFYIYLYFHMTEWLQTGFGLVIRFIGLLQIVTTSNDTVSLIHTLYISLQHLLSLLSLLRLHLSSGNDFPCRSFFSFNVPWFWSSLAVTISQQDSALLHNGLQLWEPLFLPCPHQGWLSQPRADLDCLPPSSSSTWLSTEIIPFFRGHATV